METGTMTAIKETLDSIRKNLDGFRDYHKAQGTDMDTCAYGQENEYCLRGIIGGIKNILIDVSTLVRSHILFLKLSTYNERVELNQNLGNLNSHLASRRVSEIVNSLEWLKSRLRTYNLRSDKDRFVEFSDALDNLCKKSSDLEDSIKDVSNKLTEAEETYTKIQEKQTEYNEIIQELTDKKDEFVSEYDAFVSEVGDFKVLAEKAKTNEQTVADNLKQVEEDKEIFDEFVEKIEDREKVLEKQDAATKAYEKKLEEFDQDQQKKLSEVADLIEKARQALQYTTAAGMSAAFQEHYVKTDKKWSKYGWLIAATIFLAITIGIGAWIVMGWGISIGGTDHLYSLIGRMSMVPFTILAAIFCANQYVKQKNLAEDYAYKAVLTKSIVAFSEELRKKDEKGYSEYISTVLKEIHQDPLRKRSKEKDEITLKETTGVLGKALEIIQTLTKKG